MDRPAAVPCRAAGHPSEFQLAQPAGDCADSGAEVVHPMPRSLSPGLPWALAVAMAGFGAASAPAARAGPDPEQAAAVAAVASPAITATYSDGTLVLRLSGASREAALVARWPVVEDVADNGHGYRTARLELLDDDELQEATRAPSRTLPLQGRDEWNEVVRQVMTELAPSGANEAALTLVQGEGIVFYRTPDGELRVHRHEDKPTERHVTRAVSEDEFAAHADELLHRRFPDQDLLLFQAGGGEGNLSFVFFDLARRQSVLIAAPADAQGSNLDNLMHTIVRVPDTLILRGQALGILTRPVSSALRLAWLASQTVVTIAPPLRAPGGTPPPVVSRPGMDLDAWERELDDMDLPRRYPGAIAPLIDGEAFFTGLVQALQDARKSVSIRLFIFDNDDYALRIADLIKRRSAEVRVRVLIDALGTLGAGQGAPAGAATGPPVSIAHYLRAGSKVEVRETPNTWLMSDHTKTIIVDDRLAYLGGMNIGHEYRHEWHDMMVALTGPIVGRLQRDFDVAWAYAGLGGDLAYLQALGLKDRFKGPPPGERYVDLRPLYTRTLDPQVLRAQLAAMQRAEREIWVEQPYVSDDKLVNELIAARGRGVDVRVVLPASGDSRFMNSANLLAARALVKRGVRVYVYPGMTHVKAALYDGWACVGSANFDKLSLRVNRETNVATSDPVFAGRLRQELFEADFARSRELVEPPSAGWGTYISAFVAGQL